MRTPNLSRYWRQVLTDDAILATRSMIADGHPDREAASRALYACGWPATWEEVDFLAAHVRTLIDRDEDADG